MGARIFSQAGAAALGHASVRGCGRTRDVPDATGRLRTTDGGPPVTVAAVILSSTPEGAVTPADGVPRVRRMADTAWAGGALPIVVVAADPDGSVAGALGGSVARLVPPADPAAGPAGQMAHGFRAAIAAVRETDAALLWPARLCWVDAETLTSLIEAHGVDRTAILRPAWHGTPGWPALVPTDLLAALATVAHDRMPEDVPGALAAAGHRVVSLDLGDPGCVLGAATPRADLPSYEGPPEPASGHHHEWGAAAAGPPED
jgi:CTP:molybdopterin cytidylyltransferase MocA